MPSTKLATRMNELFAEAEAAYQRAGGERPELGTLCAAGCANCPLEGHRPPPAGEVVGLEQLDALVLDANNVVVAPGRLGLTATAYLILRVARRGLPVLVLTDRLGHEAERERCLDIFEAPTVPLHLDGDWWKRTTLDDTPSVCGRRVIAGALAIGDWLSMTGRAAALTDVEFCSLHRLPTRAGHGLLIVEAAPDRASVLPKGQAATWVTDVMPREGVEGCTVVCLYEIARPAGRVERIGRRADPCQVCLPL